MEKLPIYNAVLPTQDNYWDYESGIICCSLVDNPATESSFMKFNEDNKFKLMSFSSEDSEDKRVVVGALMIPDKLIYRRSEDGIEFYVRHSKEVIAQMHERMMKNRSLYRFSVMHNGQTFEGWRATPLEVWIKEYEQDKSNAMGFDLPVGTLFMSMKVDDASIWKRIKAEEFKGFSIETLMNYEISTQENFKKQEMNKQIFSKIAIGEAVFTKPDDGASIENFSGQFVHEGQKITCEDGKITAIEPENAVHVGVTMEQVEELFEKQMSGAMSKFGEMLDGFKEKIKEDFSTAISGVNTVEDLAELKIAFQQFASGKEEPAKETKELNSFSAESFFESSETVKKQLQKYSK